MASGVAAFNGDLTLIARIVRITAGLSCCEPMPSASGGRRKVVIVAAIAGWITSSTIAKHLCARGDGGRKAVEYDVRRQHLVRSVTVGISGCRSFIGIFLRVTAALRALEAV